jgi:predicted small secreted protein
MKKLFVLFCVAVALTGCGTVKGVGNDISGMADWTKEKMTGK